MAEEDTLNNFINSEDYKNSGAGKIFELGPPPYAIAELTRGEDGTMKVVYRDMQTGMVLNSLVGYTVFTSNSYLTPEGKVVEPPPGAPPPKDSTPIKELFEKRSGGDGDYGGRNNKGVARSPTNNFGFIDKPGIVKAAGLLPGVPGMLGKAANAVVNANNVAAVNAAKQMMNVPENTTGQNVKGVLSDNQGYVGRYNIAGNPYSVGFKAEDPLGRTTLTPNEARQRSLTLGSINPMEEQAKSVSQKIGGAVAGGVNSVKSFLSKVFGDDQGAVKATPTATTTPSQTVANSSPVNGVRPSPSIGSMPAATRANTGLSPGTFTDQAGAFQSANKSVRTGTFTDQANAFQSAKPTVSSSLRPGTFTDQPNAFQSSQPKGLGLANLAPNGLIGRPTVGIPGKSVMPGYNANYGSLRPNAVNSDFAKTVVDAAQTVSPGSTVVGISGQGAYGSPRHRKAEGVAVDFDVYDAQGQKLSDNKMKDLASQYAYSNPGAGIGYGPGYMSPQRMHVDLSGYGGYWGQNEKAGTMPRALRETIDAARQGFRPTPFADAPTPTFKADMTDVGLPDYDPSTPTARTDYTKAGSFPSGTPKQSVDPRDAARAGFGFARNSQTPAKAVSAMANQRIADSSPALAANMGAIARTPAEISKISRAIAGELGPATLAGLTKNDPKAVKEFANVMATMENRAGAKKFGSLANAVSPKQYDSLKKENLGVTNNNYSKFGATLEAKVADYYAGNITPTSYGITHYYNPDAVAKTPKWDKNMVNPEKVGPHKFASLDDGDTGYGVSQSYKDARAKMGYSGLSTWGDKLSTPSEMMALDRLDKGSVVTKKETEDKDAKSSNAKSAANRDRDAKSTNAKSASERSKSESGKGLGSRADRDRSGADGRTSSKGSTSSKGQPGSGGLGRSSKSSSDNSSKSQPGSGGSSRGSGKSGSGKSEKSDKSGSEGRR